MKGEERLGPFDQPAFDELVRQGTIAPETLVWRDGMADWQPYGQAGQAPSAEPMAGDPRRRRPLQTHLHGQNHPRRGTAAEWNCAGFWIRFGAKILDILILGVLEAFASHLVFGAFFIDINTPGILVSWMIFNLFNFLARICYTWLLTWKFGGTLGKLALDLRVVTANGEPIGLGRSLGRAFAEILSVLTLLIGYIIAAFDSEKRTLHDHICSTRVIRQ